MLKFFTSRTFIANLILALTILVLLWFLLFFLLKSYTRHGESVTVPELTGLTLSQVDKHLSSKNLKYHVTDSTFIVDRIPGEVLSQTPAANAKVKQNRRIYLTVNANNPPKVKMPNLIDKSLRLAKINLKNLGLVVGDIEFVPDMAKNAVLKQSVSGKEVIPDDEIFKGTKVDLEVGDGLGNTKIDVPNLIGDNYEKASAYVQLLDLNIGSIIPLGELTDTAGAIVVRQQPAYFENRLMNIGEPIDLFITNDLDRIEALDSLENLEALKKKSKF